jgi:hypothetical protein
MSFAFNEEAYHGTRKTLNPTPCAFEKAVLARCVSCMLADKHLLAERETINCHDAQAQEICSRLRIALRANSSFALKITSDMNASLPHNKEMKVQCGGLKGLQKSVAGNEEVANVHKLVIDALSLYGDLESLPYANIVQSISNFNIRQRS